MEMNNDLLDIEIQDPIDSSQLSYEGNAEVGNLVSEATDNPSLKKGQCIWNEALALKTTPKPWDEGVSNNNSNTSLSQDTFNI